MMHHFVQNEKSHPGGPLLKARNDMRAPYLVLNRGAQEPLHRQIVRRIAAATLGADARLPSSRSLAKILRVSRNTVVSAYSELVANGSISAMRVNGAAPLSGMQIEDSDANPIYIRY
jgi:hypothetical protein